MAPQRQNVSCASCKERNKLASFVSMVLIQNTNNHINKKKCLKAGGRRHSTWNPEKGVSERQQLIAHIPRPGDPGPKSPPTQWLLSY